MRVGFTRHQDGDGPEVGHEKGRGEPEGEVKLYKL